MAEEIVNAAVEPIGIDASPINEGFNSRLDYFGKINCRVFADRDMRLSDYVVYAEPVVEEEAADDDAQDSGAQGSDDEPQSGDVA